MKLFKILLLGVLAALFALAIFAYFQPSEYEVSRSIVIDAKAEKIFPLINNQHNWYQWSPWSKMDPNMKKSFSGGDEGVGSVYEWDGGRKVGKGKSTVVISDKDKYVKFQLDFEKPMKSDAVSEFMLDEKDGKTHLKWTMSGHATFIQKAMGLMCNCSKMIGITFEQGLSNIKDIAEKK